MKKASILNRVLIFTLASSALFTTSCKKDPSVAPVQTTQSRLVKLEENATNYTAFEYNAAGSVSKVVTVNGGSSETILLNYDDNKRLTTAASASKSFKFNYNTANLLEKADLYEGSLQTPVAGYLQYIYQNGKLSEAVTYAYLTRESNAMPFYKVAYEYYANGDVKSQKEFGYNFFTKVFELSGTTTFEYDNHPNPVKGLGDIYQVSFQVASAHNPVKEVKTDEHGDLAETATYTYTYTYNKNGYPIQHEKKVIVQGQANPTVSIVKYAYQ